MSNNSFIRAGNASIANALRTLKANRENSTDYQKIFNRGIKNTTEEQLAVIKAESDVRQAETMQDAYVDRANIKADTYRKGVDAKMKTQMAGRVAAAGGLIAEGFKPERKIIKPTKVDYSKYRANFEERRNQAVVDIDNLNTVGLETEGNADTSPASAVSGASTAAEAANISGLKPSGGSLSQSQIKQTLMQAGFSDAEATTGAAIGMAESGGALNADTSTSGLDPNKTNEWSRGIMQINVQAHQDKLDRKGWTPADLSDPLKAAIISKEVYDEAGGSFRPWSAFTNQSYLKFQ